MIDIRDLPKEPLSAAKYAIYYAITKIGDGKAAILELKQKNHPLYNELFISLTIAIKSAQRILKEDLREHIIMNIELKDGDNLQKLRKNLEYAIGAIVAAELDNHFIDEADVVLFDEAKLSEEDKENIRKLMAIARSLVDRSDLLKEFQKRNILYHIAKIENELHRDKSHFQTFMAAAYQVSGYVNQLGKDVKPIADAIEKARTITEKRVDGQLKIEQEQKPKQLENLKNE